MYIKPMILCGMMVCEQSYEIWRMWCVIKNMYMYEVSRKCCIVKGGEFRVEQGVVQGCSLSPILFLNNLLKDVEEAELGIEIDNGKRIGG